MLQHTHGWMLLLAAFVIGCGTTKLFDPLPPDLDRTVVPTQTIDMTAENFHFTPEEIRVKEGTLVTLRVRAIEGTHGFSLGAFGIDELLEENQTKVIEFYAAKKGEYTFRCSHFCGIGHFGMGGKIIIE
jgi:heme/copper-type cytochrome/quinol oxidase subunit 2